MAGIKQVPGHFNNTVVSNLTGEGWQLPKTVPNFTTHTGTVIAQCHWRKRERKASCCHHCHHILKDGKAG